MFWEAVAALLRAPGVVLRLALVPSLLRLMLEVWIEQGTDPEATLSLVLYFVGDVALVAFIAVGWHRYSLLGEAPMALSARPDARRMAGYGIEWVVLGIFVMILLLIAVAPVLLLENCCFPAGTLSRFVVGDEFYEGTFSWVGLAVGVFGIYAFTWLFFRLAVSLPHLAVRQTGGARLSAWAVTKTLEPAIFVCAGVATLGTLLLWAPSIWAYDLFPDAWIFAEIPPEDSDAPYQFSAQYLALLQAVFTVQILIGASILTEIYRRAVGSAGAETA